MKIAVNTRLLLPQKLEGIGWFTLEIFKRLTQQKPEHQWFFLFDRPYSADFLFSENITALQAGPPSRHPVLWHWWFQYSVPRMLRQVKPQLLVSPDGFIPLKSEYPTLPVIHDINFEHQKQNTGKLVGQYLRYYFPRFARNGTRVATVSDYSRKDICRTYGVEQEKIDLVYNGVGTFFRPLSPQEITRKREQLSQGLPYFVFVGALNPRKNIDGMLQAYSLYRQRGGAARFVIVGEKMFWNAALDQVYKAHPYKSDIHFTGRLEGENLNQVVGAAQALSFVSHFEGFGIPILEAFRCRVPVITATNSSMPEVAGEAALLCDSNNIEQIAEAMLKTDKNEIQAELGQKGWLRGQEFSWDKSAEMMWRSIEKTLEQK